MINFSTLTPEEQADAFHSEGEGCRSSQDDWLCTRTKGHPGRHIAAGDEGVIHAVWGPKPPVLCACCHEPFARHGRFARCPDGLTQFQLPGEGMKGDE